MAAAEAAMVAHAWSIVSLAASAKASAAGMRDEDTANVESIVSKAARAASYSSRRGVKFIWADTDGRGFCPVELA